MQGSNTLGLHGAIGAIGIECAYFHAESLGHSGYVAAYLAIGLNAEALAFEFCA